ncbi:hypothetical protein D3C72_1708810 [compost metagenome]
MVAFPELVHKAFDLRLPAERAENEAAARVTVVAVEHLLAAREQALLAQKAVVQLKTGGVDEIQARCWPGLAVNHKDDMRLGQGRACVVDAGELVKLRLAAQRCRKRLVAVVAHGLRGRRRACRPRQ